MFRRRWDPGLPKEPALLVDDQHGRARVAVKAIDYRATQGGEGLAKILAVTLPGLLVWAVLTSGKQTDLDEQGRAYLAVAILGIAAWVTFCLVALAPKLVRVCAKTVTLNFYPDRVRIGRKRFNRDFRGSSVRCTFQLATDPEAHRLMATSQNLNRTQHHLLSISRRIQMVVQGEASAGNVMLGPGVAHPVLTILGDDKAEEILAVLNMAARLTEPAKPWETTDGDAGRFDADLL